MTGASRLPALPRRADLLHWLKTIGKELAMICQPHVSGTQPKRGSQDDSKNNSLLLVR